MPLLNDIGAVILGYVIGSIPFGLLIVKFMTGKDIREIESGRTGGTNAMRAAGFGAGLLTAVMDILKGTAAVLLAQALTGNPFVHVLAGVGAILGHNYSVFLIRRDEDGRVRFHGGAGGAPAVGGAVGLWGWSLPILFGLGAVVFFTVGIASVTTMAVGLFVIVLFSILASMGVMPWTYVAYGVIAELLLLWALRPNIQKLFAGKERVVKYSLHGWLKTRRQQRQSGN